jgi:S1-C subfamily serine protease
LARSDSPAAGDQASIARSRIESVGELQALLQHEAIGTQLVASVLRDGRTRRLGLRPTELR